MNVLLGEKYITVRGIENAMEVAKVLVKNDYQVMVQLDDCDIYVVAYTSNESWSDHQFALVNYDEIDLLEGTREQGEFGYLMNHYEDEVRDYLAEEEDDEYDEEDWDSDWDDDFYDDDEHWYDDEGDDEEDLDEDDWDELTDEMGDEGENF